MSDIKRQFCNYKGYRVVLYGLSTETEKVLKELGDFVDIAGLLDGFRESGELYGKKILSLSDVPDLNIKLILVVARPGSCKAITRRIGGFCKKQGLELMDIRGNNLLLDKRVVYDFKMVAGGTRAELLKKAEKADLVCFDLFDTLVMRKVLNYTDIFELMDSRLREHGIQIPDFAKRRLAAEKELAKTGSPVLVQIYRKVLEGEKALEITAEELARIEWEMDMESMVPRKAVQEIFQTLAGAGKIIYIVTDTYYTYSEIKEILQRQGITGYSRVYVSSQYNTGKRQKLFSIVKKQAERKRVLHIGDDLAADVEPAQVMGFDTFRLHNAEELFDLTGGLGLEDKIEHLSDRVKTGMLLSRLFNNPFQFESVERKIEVASAFDIGYVLCAPIICDFLFWFVRTVEKQEINNIWFSARDGYLLWKMAEKMGISNATYFLTSRIAAIRSGMECEADILYVDSMKYSGSLKENLRVRFGLDTVFNVLDRIPEINGGLLQYKEAILQKAEAQRVHVRKYIDTLCLSEGKIAFFDFVAKGTTQMYVQKLVDHSLKGLYFLQLEPEFMEDKGLDIETFFRKDEQEKSSVFENYYILETILTAPHGQVLEFDENGEAVYAQDTRSDSDIQCLMEVQKGILCYFEDYLELVPVPVRTENKKLDEAVLGLLQGVRITDKVFLEQVVDDPFFNRKTELMDLV